MDFCLLQGLTMAQQQPQSAQQQLLGRLRQLLREETPKVKVEAIDRVSSKDETICAALMQEEDAVLLEFAKLGKAGGRIRSAVFPFSTQAGLAWMNDGGKCHCMRR
jgi:hypothetical protein